MKKRIGLLFFVVFVSLAISAKEGMWLPILLEKYNIEEMQQMGFKLTAEDIYNVNQASLKDAVVIFGSGCTGELISNEGLLITNYHCGYRQIQSHSSIENNMLTDGYWAMNKDEELPNPGLSVRFLEYMKDVTAEVLEGTERLPEAEIKSRIRRNSARIVSAANENNNYFAQVKPLFYGNQYFLYVYKVYTDVRLVGAPPSSIGKFGGDIDNWMWPRHTGDFSLFRIYADKNNEPVPYSPDNIPFQPKKFFPISLKGVQPEDFTMIFGNPGSTQQYIPHQEVDIIMNQRDPDRVKIRDKKLQIVGDAMDRDPKVRIQYAAKYQSIGNSWKKWQGEIKGLKRLDAVNKKINFEKEFEKWAIENSVWQTIYKPVFEEFAASFTQYREIIKVYDYYSEIVLNGPEIFKVAVMVNAIINSLESEQADRAEMLKTNAMGSIELVFRNFHQPTDEKLFTELLPLLNNDLESEFLPSVFREVMEKYDKQKLLKRIYRKSVLSNKTQLVKLLKTSNEKQILKLRKDPMIELVSSLNYYYEVNLLPVVDSLRDNINNNMKIYMAGIMDMQKDQPLYPDANLTLRVAYGKVEGYEPQDGIEYKYYTTLSGLMEKDNPAIYEYSIPEKLKELYNNKDFGIFAVDGEMPVCFTASNHTSGGNSGSPVINGNGELVGVNFDRCWEATMSDIMYDPEMCRNISIDIRYALFIIDKFAGAGYLLDEMKILR